MLQSFAACLHCDFDIYIAHLLILLQRYFNEIKALETYLKSNKIHTRKYEEIVEQEEMKHA